MLCVHACAPCTDFQLDEMYEAARKDLENATWDALRKPWKSAVDPQTGRKYFYNNRTQQSLWYMPILERQAGTQQSS